MKNSFKRALGGLAVIGAILLAANGASAADIKERSLKIAFVNIKEHPHGLGAQKFADIVTEFPAEETARMREKLTPVADKYSHEIGEPLMKEMLAEIEKVRTR